MRSRRSFEKQQQPSLSPPGGRGAFVVLLNAVVNRAGMCGKGRKNKKRRQRDGGQRIDGGASVQKNSTR